MHKLIVIVIAIVVILCSYLNIQPVVFKTTDGEVCGCLAGSDYPTLDECNKFDINAIGVDVIEVSTCN